MFQLHSEIFFYFFLCTKERKIKNKKIISMEKDEIKTKEK